MLVEQEDALPTYVATAMIQAYGDNRYKKVYSITDGDFSLQSISKKKKDGAWDSKKLEKELIVGKGSLGISLETDIVPQIALMIERGVLEIEVTVDDDDSKRILKAQTMTPKPRSFKKLYSCLVRQDARLKTLKKKRKKLK